MQPQPPHQHPYHSPQPPAGSQKRTNQLAIASLVAGIVGWMGVPLVASVIAVVCGHMARTQIKQSGEDGDGFAILGLVLGYTHLVGVCIGMAVFVAIWGGIGAFFLANGIPQQ